MLPEDRIDDWINPYSKPEEVLPYALSDMIIEKADDGQKTDPSE